MKTADMRFMLAIVVSLAFLMASCGTLGASYTPPAPFPPITFTIDSAGNISAHLDPRLVTEVGTFTLSAGVSSSLQPEDHTMLVVIRHKQNGSTVDTVYKIQTDQDKVIVIVDGRTIVQVTNRKVVIDASQGNVKSIAVGANQEEISAALANATTVAEAANSSENPYPPYQGALILDDPMDKDTGNWVRETDLFDTSCKFFGGALHVRVNNQNPPITSGLESAVAEGCSNTFTSNNSFTFQTQMRIIKGNYAGFSLFYGYGKSTLDFLINQDGSYEVIDAGVDYNVGRSTLINTGLNNSNLIAATANNGIIKMYVNLHLITSIKVKSSPDISLSWIVSADPHEEAEAAFSNTKVWTN